MGRWLVMAFVAFSIAGCMGNRIADDERGLNAGQIDAKDDAICQSYGNRPGSSGYRNCRISLNSNRAHSAFVSEPSRCRPLTNLGACLGPF